MLLQGVLFKEIQNCNYYYSIIDNNDISSFAILINKILLILYPQNLKLFFLLMQQSLSIRQKNYIENDLPIVLNEKENMKLEYENRISILESNHLAKIDQFINEEQEINNQFRNQISIDNDKIKLLDKKIELKIEQLNLEQLNTVSNTNQLQSKVKETDALKIKIKELVLQISNDKLLLDEKETLMNSLYDKINLTYNEHSSDFKNRWDLENKNLICQNKSLEYSCNKLRQDQEELKTDIEMLSDKIKCWNIVVKEYVDNIDKNIINNALNSSLLEISSKDNNENLLVSSSCVYPYIKENIRSKIVEECTNINMFAENIAINLESIGVGNYADELANYIVGILACGLTPLICGYKARQIATAISTAYSGETPFIISLPSGYTNARALNNIYCQTGADCILIEDAVGTMNENALLPMLRSRSQNDFEQKMLLLAAENYDSIKYMPTNFFDYVAIVSINKLVPTKKTEYVYNNAKNILEKFVCEEVFDYEHKKIKKLLTSLNIHNSYKFSRSRIIGYSNKLSNIKIAIQGYVRSELKIVCELKDLYEQIKKNITSNGHEFENDLFNIIQGDDDE